MTNQKTNDNGINYLKLSKKLYLSKLLGCIHLKQEKGKKLNLKCLLKRKGCALRIAAQSVGRHPVKQKVTSLNPSQGACLGCRFSPWMGRLGEALLIDVSLSHQCFSPSLPLALKRNKILKKKKGEKKLEK